MGKLSKSEIPAPIPRLRMRTKLTVISVPAVATLSQIRQMPMALSGFPRRQKKTKAKLNKKKEENLAMSLDVEARSSNLFISIEEKKMCQLLQFSEEGSRRCHPPKIFFFITHHRRSTKNKNKNRNYAKI